MTKEHVVEIKGSMYRYRYNPDTQRTDYLGPVGSSPGIDEEDFLAAMKKKKQAKATQQRMINRIDPFYRDAVQRLADGEGILVYHGTTRNFDEFDIDRSRTWMNKEYQGDALFFSLDRDVAERYAYASRQASLHPDVMDEIERNNPEAAMFIRNIYEHGYEKGWEKNLEHFGAEGIWDIGGVDGNELSDLVDYIEGAKIDPREGEDLARLIFSMETKSIHEGDLETLRKLGVVENYPNSQVYVVKIESDDVWVTNNRVTAKVWDHDVVVYFGPDSVDDVPEIIVHRNTVPVHERITLPPVEVIYE